MQYVFLVRVSEGAQPTAEESDPGPWWEDAHRRGKWVAGDRLRGPSDATTVRVRDGQVLVTDGPFAEVKEQIAGFDLIEAEDIEDAVAVASGHPVTRFGAIEVREVWPF